MNFLTLQKNFQIFEFFFKGKAENIVNDQMDKVEQIVENLITKTSFHI